jgi:hypothetical protein
MEIKIKKMIRKNFQGEGIVTFEFSPLANTVQGDNRSGKTTTYNSFLWLLYGKNGEWKSKFDICPLDKNNNYIPYLDTEVEAVLDVDGTELQLKKVVVRKWDKDEETEDINLRSEPVSYYVNDTKVKKADYDKRIRDLAHEELFKLLTSTTYFASLHWEKRRDLLMDWVGDVDPVIKYEKFADLFYYINEKKMSLDNYRSNLSFEL